MTCTADYRNPLAPCAHCEREAQKMTRATADEEYDDLRADGFRTVQERQLSEEAEFRRGF